MPRLTLEQKLFIVQRLAQFYSPTEVSVSVEEYWQIQVPTAQIVLYNPTVAAGRSLCARLRILFETARASFVADQGRQALGHRVYRLRELDRLYRANKNASPWVQLRLLELARRESNALHEAMGKKRGRMRC